MKVLPHRDLILRKRIRNGIIPRRGGKDVCAICIEWDITAFRKTKIHSHLRLIVAQVRKACALIASTGYFGRLHIHCTVLRLLQHKLELTLLTIVGQIYTFCVSLGYMIIISKYVYQVLPFLVQYRIGICLEPSMLSLMDVVDCVCVVHTVVGHANRSENSCATP